MKVNNISRTNFGAKIYIPVKQNFERNNYIFNQVNDIVKQYRLQGTWNNIAIKLPNISEDAIQELKKLGITFTREE